MKRLLVLSVGVLLIFLCSTFAYAVEQTNTWTGNGDGVSYSDPDNWSLSIVPCNFGTVEFITIIPYAFTVNVDMSGCEVTKLTLEDNSRLITTPGNDYIMDVADINGTIEANNGAFFANPFYLLGNGARALMWSSKNGHPVKQL